jgi:hypothetical protein
MSSTGSALRNLFIGFFFAALWSGWRTHARYAGWRRTLGTVIENKCELRDAVNFDDVSRHMYASVIQYTTHDGKLRTYQDPFWSLTPAYAVGARVTLRYDPAAPDSVIIVGWRPYLACWCLSIAATVCLLFSLAA